DVTLPVVPDPPRLPATELEVGVTGRRIADLVAGYPPVHARVRQRAARVVAGVGRHVRRAAREVRPRQGGRADLEFGPAKLLDRDVEGVASVAHLVGRQRQAG